jgi:hypothetical protein
LSFNKIWDIWAKAIINNMELKEWVELNLWGNEFSEEMEERLKEWEKTYHDRWINCKVII